MTMTTLLRKIRLSVFFEQEGRICKLPEREELDNIRNEVSILIGELKRYGCRRKD